MERTIHTGWAVMAAVVMVGCMVSNAEATPFPTSGGSYTANVAYRVDPLGNQLSSATGTTGHTQSGSASGLIDYSPGPWNLSGMVDSTQTATASFTLDKVYSLNKIRTQYNAVFGTITGDYELRASPDNSSWTTLVSRTGIPTSSNTVDDSFAAQDVQYIDWQVWGPGYSTNGGYLYLTELMAFVDSGAPAPQKEEGYNLAIGGTVKSESGWQSWGPASGAIDNNMRTDGASPLGTGTAVYDLGDSYWVTMIRAGLYGSLQSKIEISNDELSWSTIVDASISTSSYNMSPTLARYVRLTASGGGHFRELSVYATEEPVADIPEPATMALLAVGGLAALLRRRRA